MDDLGLDSWQARHNRLSSRIFDLQQSSKSSRLKDNADHRVPLFIIALGVMSSTCLDLRGHLTAEQKGETCGIGWLADGHCRFQRLHELGNMLDHARILLMRSNLFHDCTADDHPISHFRYARGILRCRHTKPHGNGSYGNLSQFLDILLDVCRIAQLCPVSET